MGPPGTALASPEPIKRPKEAKRRRTRNELLKRFDIYDYSCPIIGIFFIRNLQNKFLMALRGPF
jgi:hypothetical protein